MKNKHLKPYIRRANGKEEADSLRIALRLAFYQVLGKPFYVMVQHGFRNTVLDCARTKREIKQSILLVKMKKQTFRNWCNKVQKIAINS